MSKKIKLVLAIILFLIGFMIFVYPIITNYLYDKKVDNLEKKYEEIIKLSEDSKKVSTENNKYTNIDFTSIYNLLNEENNKIYQDNQKSFLNQSISYEDTLIDLTNYGFTENIIGFMSIPSIDVKLPIYLGANTRNMRLGAVHLTGSSYPIGGVNTNSVIAAHRGYYKALMFRHIDKIDIGDTLYIKNFKETLEYRAVRTDIIKPSELNKLTIEEGKDMITIISCHPFPHNYERYVVYFERA